MRRISLIARREIVAYAGVPSFWAALLMGPLLMALAALGAGTLGGKGSAPPVTPVAVAVADPALALAVSRSLNDAAALEHRAVAVRAEGEAKGAKTTLRLVVEPAGLNLKIEGDRLSDLTLALLRRDLAAAVSNHSGPIAGAPLGEGAAIAVVQPPPPAAPADPGRFGRFSMTTLLWLVLVGSLGMLLQAIVRERSNRALESLLAAVRPSEIVLGKLAGVGALSTLVIAVWLAGGALVAVSPLGGATPAAGLLLQGFEDFGALAAAGGFFLLAFAMYGSALIGLGALACDVPAAQNLSRPVFGVLLAVFFVALGQLVGVGVSLPMLALFPPFAPFVLILAKPGSIDAAHTALAVGGMGLTTVVCLWLASLALKGERPRFFGRRQRTASLVRGAA